MSRLEEKLSDQLKGAGPKDEKLTKM